MQAERSSGEENQYQFTTYEIDQALSATRRDLYALTADPEFHEELMKQGVDPYDDIDKPVYWDNVAEFSRKRMLAAIETGDEIDQLEAKALFIVAATPAAMFASAAAKTLPRDQRDALLPGLQNYNNCIKEFGKNYPATSVRGLRKAMLEAVTLSSDDPTYISHANEMINKRTTGAQHESAYDQILAATGRRYTPASQSEDLFGIDYVIYAEDKGAPFLIDLKSNLRQISPDGNLKYTVRNNGIIVMHSMVTPYELHDTFQISPEAAAEKAIELNAMLGDIKSQAA